MHAAAQLPSTQPPLHCQPLRRSQPILTCTACIACATWVQQGTATNHVHLPASGQQLSLATSPALSAAAPARCPWTAAAKTRGTAPKKATQRAQAPRQAGLPQRALWAQQRQLWPPQRVEAAAPVWRRGQLWRLGPLLVLARVQLVPWPLRVALLLDGQEGQYLPAMQAAELLAGAAPLAAPSWWAQRCPRPAEGRRYSCASPPQSRAAAWVVPCRQGKAVQIPKGRQDQQARFAVPAGPQVLLPLSGKEAAAARRAGRVAGDQKLAGRRPGRVDSQCVLPLAAVQRARAAATPAALLPKLRRSSRSHHPPGLRPASRTWLVDAGNVRTRRISKEMRCCDRAEHAPCWKAGRPPDHLALPAHFAFDQLLWP